ncbi:hypothetical protein GGR27_001135 [Lewinella antarctica]|uniref:Uncharacterized protein n=1 Tax=Neolewinella antarctica TaxID=442734 RepID=A0ABX0X8Q4_9BACT|nr:hypothetical protein [Neolewinella antarctica]
MNSFTLLDIFKSDAWRTRNPSLRFSFETLQGSKNLFEDLGASSAVKPKAKLLRSSKRLEKMSSSMEQLSC